MAEFDTNPGDRSVGELEREVDRERERVSATIDELQARASVGNLVDQVVKAIGENGGEVSRNLGRSLRDNPLAALLTGVGLAWLMAGSGRPGYASSLARPRGFGRDRAYEPSGSAASDYPTSPDDLWPGSPDADGTIDRDSLEQDEGGLRERVADVAGRVGEGVSRTVGGLGERASEVSHAAKQAGETLHGAGDAVRQGVRHGAGAARRSAAETTEYVRSGFDTLMEEQPLVAGAIAMALGAAVGGALPRSRVEDRMLGAQSDRAMEAVRDLAMDQGAKVKAMAEEAMEIADEASAELGEKLPSGEEIVDAADRRVRDAAERLREASGVETGEESSDRPTR